MRCSKYSPNAMPWNINYTNPIAGNKSWVPAASIAGPQPARGCPIKPVCRAAEPPCLPSCQLSFSRTQVKCCCKLMYHRRHIWSEFYVKFYNICDNALISNVIKHQTSSQSQNRYKTRTVLIWKVKVICKKIINVTLKLWLKILSNWQARPAEGGIKAYTF